MNVEPETQVIEPATETAPSVEERKERRPERRRRMVAQLEARRAEREKPPEPQAEAAEQTSDKPAEGAPQGQPAEPKPRKTLQERLAEQKAAMEAKAAKEQRDAELEALRRERDEAKRLADERRGYIHVDDLDKPEKIRASGGDPRRALDGLAGTIVDHDRIEIRNQLAEERAAREALEKRWQESEKARLAELQERAWADERSAVLEVTSKADRAPTLAKIPPERRIRLLLDAQMKLRQDGIAYDRDLVVDLAEEDAAEFARTFGPPPPAPAGPQSNPSASAGSQRPNRPPRTLTADLESQTSGAPAQLPKKERKRQMVDKLAKKWRERDAKR